MSRKRLPVWRTLVVMAADLAMIAAGLFFAYWFRFESSMVPLSGGWSPEHYLGAMPWVVALWFFALRFENLYRRRSKALDFNVLRRILTGSCIALLILLAYVFYARKGEAFSRQFSVIMLFSVLGFLVFGRVILYAIFRWMLIQQGVGQSRVVVMGGGPVSIRLVESMLRRPERGMKPVGIVLGRSDAAPETLPGGVEIIGCARNGEELEKILTERRVDEVILTETDCEGDQLVEMLRQCERSMAEFRIVPSTTELLLTGMTVETVDGIPMLGVRETPLQGWNAALKRMIDFTTALVGMIVLAPVVAVFAFLIRRQDGHPAFFRQERMGIDGRRFEIVKLRSMPVDAENATGPVFSEDVDPRCTPLGQFLRRSHLDEIPQLLNVVRGEMSLVGPRPERPYFVEQFRDGVPRYMARHKVKSGITGWAQVNGLCGKHGAITERLKYDLYYIENWSLWLDVKILVKTVFGLSKPGPAQPGSV